MTQRKTFACLYVFVVCVSMYECLLVCECFFSIALSSSVYRLPGGLDPIRCCGHVGGFRRCHTGSSCCICPGGHFCEVFHNLQPNGLPAVQAQLSRVPLQRHIYVTTKDLQRESTVRSKGTFQIHLPTQHGQERFHTFLKWTAGELWDVSPLR